MAAALHLECSIAVANSGSGAVNSRHPFKAIGYPWDVMTQTGLLEPGLKRSG